MATSNGEQAALNDSASPALGSPHDDRRADSQTGTDGRSGAAGDSWRAGEPTLADVQHEFPHWRCSRGISGLHYAQHTTIGKQVSGEDPLDLRDQIRAAEARHAYDHPEITEKDQAQDERPWRRPG
jgi:hypothetical protein